jgi:hypothetical protein
MNCPICDKAGLPDYRIEPTICPQCNTDLKSYYLLQKVSKNNVLNRVKSIIIIFLVIGIIFLGFIFYNNNKSNHLSHQYSLHQIGLLEDSLSKINTRISFLVESHQLEKQNEICIEYKIKDGDCLSVIAEFFYGDWKKYKKIQDDNNLVDESILEVGQIILIKF